MRLKISPEKNCTVNIEILYNVEKALKLNFLIKHDLYNKRVITFQINKRKILMKKGYKSLLMTAAFFLIFASLTVQCTKMQTDQQVKARIERTITGEIATGYKGNYIIRSKKGTVEVFSILNPEPKILDEYIKSGKVVDIDIQVVNGDNIEIKKIDGKEYP
jgi:hypothetical protein